MAAERGKREGSKPMGFFRNSDTVKRSGEFLRDLASIGYPSHTVFLSYSGYASKSERHVVFTPQMQVILDFITKGRQF